VFLGAGARIFLAVFSHRTVSFGFISCRPARNKQGCTRAGRYPPAYHIYCRRNFPQLLCCEDDGKLQRNLVSL